MKPAAFLYSAIVLLLLACVDAFPAADDHLPARSEDVKPLPCDSHGNCPKSMFCYTDPQNEKYCVFEKLTRGMAISIPAAADKLCGLGPNAMQHHCIPMEKRDIAHQVCSFIDSHPGTPCPPGEKCEYLEGWDYPVCIDDDLKRDTTSIGGDPKMCRFRANDCLASEHCAWAGFDYPTCVPNSLAKRDEDDQPCISSSACPPGQHCKYGPHGYPVCVPIDKSERDEAVGPRCSPECERGEFCFSDDSGSICVVLKDEDSGLA